MVEITEQVSATLQNAQGLEQQALAREEKLFIDLVSDVTAESNWVLCFNV